MSTFFVPNEANPPVGQILVLRTTERDTAVQFDASVSLRSCATTTSFEGRVFLDNNVALQRAVVPNGSTIRSAHFVLPLTADRRCHKIEYLVTTRFDQSAGDFRTPVNQGELASIVWFVGVTDGRVLDVDECPKLPPG